MITRRSFGASPLRRLCGGVRMLLITERSAMEQVLDQAVQGNTAQRPVRAALV